MTNTGITMVSAAIQQLEGIDKLHMMVMVPPTTGIVMPAGMSVVVYNKEQVEKLEKKEKIDDKTLVGQKLMFTICHQNG
jgi:invasion protein IalB